MYRVYADGMLIYHSKMDSMRIFNPSLDLELNKTGAFTFTLYPDHPYYALIGKMKSIITVYQGGFLLFRGRVLDEEYGFHNQRSFACEGDTAFLLDSIQRPVSFTGTAAEFLQRVLENHNAQVEQNKRFALGSVTVDGTIAYDEEEYLTSRETLQKGLLDALGGYLMTRLEGETVYLDYLKEINLLAPQTIEFGKNLMDMKRIRKGADIATAVIPLGAKIEGTDRRLTIEAAHDGLDMIVDEDAQAQYGLIVKSVTFDDITDTTELLIKGKAYLAGLVKETDTLDLTAADLATVGMDTTSFHLGTQVQVTSNIHGINQRLQVSKLAINLLEPAQNKLTLGGVIETFTQKTSKPIAVTAKDGRDGEDGVTLRIDSSRGTVFKNNTVSTTLKVVIFKGGKTITDAAAMRREFGTAAHLEWGWQRIGEDTFGTILTTDERLTDEGFSLLLTPQDVDVKVVFKCSLVTA